MKNDYVKLEPRPKEIFKSSDALTMESSVQVGITHIISISLNDINSKYFQL